MGKVEVGIGLVAEVVKRLVGEVRKPVVVESGLVVADKRLVMVVVETVLVAVVNELVMAEETVQVVEENLLVAVGSGWEVVEIVQEEVEADAS